MWCVRVAQVVVRRVGDGHDPSESRDWIKADEVVSFVGRPTKKQRKGKDFEF